MTGFICKIKAGDFWWVDLLIYCMSLPSAWAAGTLGSCCQSSVTQGQLWPRSRAAHSLCAAALPAWAGSCPSLGGSWVSTEQPRLFSHHNTTSLQQGCPLLCFCCPKRYPARNESTQICCLVYMMHGRDHLTFWLLQEHRWWAESESGPRAAKAYGHPLGRQSQPKATQPVLVLSRAGWSFISAPLPFNQGPRSTMSLPAEPSSEILPSFSAISLSTHKNCSKANCYRHCAWLSLAVSSLASVAEP